MSEPVETFKSPRPGHGGMRSPADVALRRAWWSLAGYPVSLVAAFVIGEGLATALGVDTDDLSFWPVLVAAVPALVVFCLPGVLAVRFGRRAVALGRSDGKVPAILGAAIGAGFVLLNLASGLAAVIQG